MVRYDSEFKRESIAPGAMAALRTQGKKWCPRCKRVRLLSAFGAKQIDGKPSYQAYCRKCKYRIAVEHKAKHLGEEDLTIEARWNALVDKTGDGCWIWKGRLDSNGYAQITFRGKNTSGSRVAYFLANGAELSPRKKLRLNCGNRKCVRLDHWGLAKMVNAPRLNTKRGKSLRARRDRRMLLEVEAAIPPGLPVEVRNEMRQRLVIAALSGRKTHYAKVTPEKTRAAMDLAWDDAYGDPWRLSIDIPVSDDEESETYRDILPDTSIFADPAVLVEAARRFDNAAE